MANRLFQQFRLSLEKQVVDLWLHATIGASGAITMDASKSKGIASITKNVLAGNYTIVLQDPYNRLLMVQPLVTSFGGGTTFDQMCVLSSSDVTAGQLSIQFDLVGTGVVDLNSGDILDLQITLSNSTAP